MYEVGEHDNRPYIVFELIDGGSLKSYVAGKPKRATYGASLVEALASAVQLAHEREIIHRDLKPSNVLLDANGDPRVTDFGLAKQKNNDVSDTRAGAVLGTPAYMSPEQASVNPDEITSATDIYAL
ncbi:MAG: serine/threonine protein kinase, partial [Planctomycetaceae bacterium]|nr:serine/threonine protein kinase [Planctomycetaceae bacterium]